MEKAFSGMISGRVALQDVCGMENNNPTRERYTFLKS